MGLLSDTDAKRIEAKIGEIEARTATEIVVAVTRRSSGYERQRILITGGLLFLVSLFAAWLGSRTGGGWHWGTEAVGWRQAVSVWVLVVLQVPVGFALYVLSGVPWVLRRLVPRREAAEAVGHRALQLFAERGVHRTQAATGLLLFASELERRVVILGDAGIDAVVGKDGWERQVQRLVAAIRGGHSAEGFLEVLGEMAPILEELVPVTGDNPNELDNQVIRDE